ncbi:hypothetical protein [Confluentibacter flavum]|uniref:Lysoplasmalogenase n=1 Tax=Confluentibacter flavum TaxID=1909700 RepID=A0A2N3HIZ7_9FLAO|nr:hypothetical protein [Confluentibacter flavum]PKQ44862.1 hypothetical protein CSW08_11150 [Confluentibacter flavum]
MNNTFKIGYDAMFFFALLLLITLNVFAAYSENPLFLNASKVIFIPFFLIAFCIKKRIVNLVFIAFLVFSFFGDASGLFLVNDFGTTSSNTMYMFSYIGLIVIGASKFKLVNIDKVVGFYLLGILLINGYFLYSLCSMLNALITDGTEMILFGTKSMALILLVFISFAVYLGKQTKASILFLIMAICFAFSDVLEYVVHYYVYNWSILMLDRLLHIAGLFFAFQYIIETNKVSKGIYDEKDILEKTFSREKIMA